MLLISVAEDSGSSACYKTLEIVTSCAFFFIITFIYNRRARVVGECRHVCARAPVWTSEELVTSSAVGP